MSAFDNNEEFYLIMKEKEEKQTVNPDYIYNIEEMTSEIRNKLVDWLISVCYRLECKQEILYTTVYIMDKFFSLENKIKKINFQLVAITSFFIAYKFEDRMGISKYTCVEHTDYSYGTGQIVQLELIILEKLNFDINVDTLHSFLEILSETVGIVQRSKLIANAIADLCLLDNMHLKYRRSMLAVSILVVINILAKREVVLSKELESLSGYTLEDLQSPISFVMSVLKRFVDILDGEAVLIADSIERKYESMNGVRVVNILKNVVE